MTSHQVLCQKSLYIKQNAINLNNLYVTPEIDFSSHLWTRLRCDISLRNPFSKTNHRQYILITYTGAQHDFLIRWYVWRLTVTRLLSLVEQERLTLPEHLSFVFYCLFFYPFTFDHCVVCPSFCGSPQFRPHFYWGSYIAQSVVFCRVFCILLFVLLSFYF